MNWFECQLDRLRAVNPLVVDGLLAIVFAVIGISTVFSQTINGGLTDPDGLAAFTTVLACAPITIRRLRPLLALTLGCVAISVHLVLDYPEGSLPLSLLFLTYSVAVASPTRRAIAGLGVVYLTLLVLVATEAPGLDALTVLGNMAFFGVAWAIGVALKARRETLEARVREADERSNVERQRSARVLAEERLRIARELHDVVAHSMSVIAVQAGVGMHVLDDRPAQARASLEAISATSRGALTEMRRLLGVLRDDDGERSRQPTPGLSDVPRLVEDVRAAGVPVALDVRGTCTEINPGLELSAFRVVQEALTNVIKHAGSPSRVAVTIDQAPDGITVEIADDGRGAAAGQTTSDHDDSSGHGLIGMRERVELWGGELSAGPVPGGGYRVRATLPYGDAE